MLPPRCFTCNNFLGHKWEAFTNRKDGRQAYKELLDELDLRRICCRRMLLTHVDITEDVAMYSSVTTVMDESKTIFDLYVKRNRTVKCD